jgi:predicted small metal-binding protein
MSTNTNVQQKKVICRAPGCQFEVRDNEEDEIIGIILDHAQRKHQASLTAEHVRAAMQVVTSEGSTKEGT